MLLRQTGPLISLSPVLVASQSYLDSISIREGKKPSKLALETWLSNSEAGNFEPLKLVYNNGHKCKGLIGLIFPPLRLKLYKILLSEILTNF